ncbi:hypothetical protein [Inquilinus sp. CAU 1745]|uniref:hypothetical protein n=1 Tax=Inquilinus sp. CAU 1745 TaxID=3140369 RepID=UPI00325A5BEB
MRTMTKTLAVALVATGLLGIPAVLAQNQSDQAPRSEAPMMNDMEGMMPGGGMMRMMGMMSQMNEMMATCTEMMQAMAQQQPAASQQNQEGNG